MAWGGLENFHATGLFDDSGEGEFVSGHGAEARQGHLFVGDLSFYDRWSQNFMGNFWSFDGRSQKIPE